MELKKQTLAEAIRPVLVKNVVADALNVSTRGLEIMVREGRFIAPFYLGDRSPRWLAADVERWLAEKAAEAQTNAANKQPIEFRRGVAPHRQ